MTTSDPFAPNTLEGAGRRLRMFAAGMWPRERKTSGATQHSNDSGARSALLAEKCPRNAERHPECGHDNQPTRRRGLLILRS